MAMATTQDQRKKKSATDYANSAVNTVQTAKQVAIAAQKAQAVVSFIATTWEVWAVVIGIIIVVVLFLTIITAITGQGNSPAPTPQPGPAPVQGQTLTCQSGDYTTCLKDDFNVIVSAGTNDDLMKIFQAFAFAGQSSLYVSLLESGGQTLKIIVDNAQACAAQTYGPTGVIIVNNGCFTLPFSSYRYLVVHESGHIINARNGLLFKSFPWTDLQSEDSSCYESGYLKSYALRAGVDPKDESFAEAIADSLVKSSDSGVGAAKLIADFPAECPNTYSWIMSNIYGPDVKFY